MTSTDKCFYCGGEFPSKDMIAHVTGCANAPADIAARVAAADAKVSRRIDVALHALLSRDFRKKETPEQAVARRLFLKLWKRENEA